MSATLNKRDLRVSTPYGWNNYEFYAVAMKSKTLHYADAMDHDFDENDDLHSFSTECGRWIRGEFSDWQTNGSWKLAKNLDDAKQIGYTKICRGCRHTTRR
jgi:hypothetical protein